MIADGTGYILLCLRDTGMDGVPDHGPACFGCIGMPALQAMLSRQVDEERQGQLQGSLAALTSLTSIVGPPLHGDLCGFYNNVERVGMDCRRCPLLALPAGAASRALERRRATSRSLIVETIGLCHAGQGDFRQAIRALGVRLERWPSQILPDHEQDADDLKRTQRLIQEQPS